MVQAPVIEVLPRTEATLLLREARVNESQTAWLKVVIGSGMRKWNAESELGSGPRQTQLMPKPEA